MEPTSVDDLFREEDEREARARTSGTGGWVYLGLLTAVFLVLAGVAYGCERRPVTGVDTVSGAIEPVEVILRVRGPRVTLEGRVPETGLRTQLLGLGEARYGPGNVDDALVVDEQTTLATGAVSVRGSTVEGDPNPAGLQADIASALELRPGRFDVTFTAPDQEPEPLVELGPAEVAVVLRPDAASLTGVVPDEGAAAALVAATENIWESVDAQGLTAGDVSWDAGVVVLTGVVEAGDLRPPRLVEAVRAALPPGVVIDAAAVTVDTGAEARQRLQQRLSEELLATPVVFDGESAELDASSEAVLARLAAVLAAAPGVPVEITGHSDPLDDPAQALALSGQRAQVVAASLIEQGIDPARIHLAAGGADDPIADSSTEEGRASNRRVTVRFLDTGG